LNTCRNSDDKEASCPFVLFREIWWPASESPCDEEGERSCAEAQEGSKKRDQAAGTDSQGPKDSGQVGVQEQDAKPERWKEEEIDFHFCDSLFYIGQENTVSSSEHSFSLFIVLNH
jgi:hypothetical protein